MSEKQLSSSYIRGWKQIAGKIGVTIRHAHRLEKDKGLPVRRDAHLREVRIREEDLKRWRSGDGATGAALPSVLEKHDQPPTADSDQKWYRRPLLWAGLLAALGSLVLALAIAFGGE